MFHRELILFYPFIHSFIPSLSLSSMALNIDLIYQFIRVFQYQVPVYTGNYGYVRYRYGNVFLIFFFFL